VRPSVIERLRSMMDERSLTAVVVGSPENFAYVGGFVVPSHPLMRWRHAFAVITAAGEYGVVCVDMEESTVRGRLPDADLRVWAEFEGDPIATLGELLADFGLADRRVGIESDFVPAGEFARLTALLPAVEFMPVEHDLAALRRIKDDDEIALLRRLSRISDQAIASAFASVSAGATEFDLAAALVDSVFKQGADQFKLMIVATGERSQLPNVGPTSRVLKPMDVCRVEIFSVIDGYQAGVCRTAVVTEPPPRAVEIWAGLVSCQRILLETIKPGAAASRVWQAFKAEFDPMGFPSIAFAGHGIGVHLHEEPYIGPFGGYVLQAGMVLGIEPLVYRTGLGFGLQLKDMIAVTPEGCEILSDISLTDELAVI
jgi:Xaa-Pro dipeptidase